MKNIKLVIKEYLYIVLGTFMLSVSVIQFLAPSKFSAGGAGTISTVLYYLFGLKMSITNFVLSSILFVFGYKYLGKNAVIKTIFGIITCSVAYEICSYFPVYTGDPFVATISGGILMGIGIGLTTKQEASTGGSDFAALILHKVLPHISIATLILWIDSIIITISGIIFKSFTIMIYSIISLYISSYVTDLILTVGDKAKSVFIISEKNNEISDIILNDFGRGVTGIKGKGMYTSSDKNMLFCVISPKELPKLVDRIHQIDRSAFIIINEVNEVLGMGFKENTKQYKNVPV